MFAFVPCHACGVAIDLDSIPPMPGKRCPCCKAPLDNVALDAEHFGAGDTSPRADDPVRLAARAQVGLDIARMTQAHEALKVAALSASSSKSAPSANGGAA